MCKGISLVGIRCNLIFGLIKLLPQIEECICFLFIVGSGSAHTPKELLIQGVYACPIIPPVFLRWDMFYFYCLIKKFELYFHNCLCPIERDHVCILSYIPTKTYVKTVMLPLLNREINVL